MRRLPDYSNIFPIDQCCPECGELCAVIGEDNSFDYAGTHCTYGRGGTWYPDDWGRPVSSCCHAPLELPRKFGDLRNADFEEWRAA